MTLTTHAIVGGALASLVPNEPILAVSFAVVSHFVIDAIPHRDYKIFSESLHPAIGAKMKYDKALALDFLRMGGDFILGLALAILFFASAQNFQVIFLGALAGQLPDTLHFAYLRTKREPFVSIHKFHNKIQAEHLLADHPIIGFITQVAFVAVVVFLANFFSP